MELWPWLARARSGGHKPTTVKATTYLAALCAATRHYGFVKHRYDGEEELEIWKVEVRVVREHEMAAAKGEAA